MNDFPQKPQLGQPGGANPQFTNQPDLQYDQGYAHPAQQQPQYQEEPPPAPGKKPGKKIPTFMIIFCVLLLGGTIALWMFKDEIQTALGKKEVAKEKAVAEAKQEEGEDFMDNATGDYIAAEENNVPVEATEEWKRRYREGKNQHGIFYVPIATMGGAAEEAAEPNQLERDDLSALSKPRSVAALDSSGFEGSSTEEWRRHGNCSIAVSSEAAKEGSNSLLVTGRESTSDYPERDLSTTLKKDKLFKLTVFVQLKNKDAADVKLVVIVNEGSGDQQQIVVKKEVANDKFTQLSGDFSLAAESPLSVKLAVICNDDTAEFYIDEVSAKPSI